MKLLVLVLNNKECVSKILREMLLNNIGGATILESTGMLKTINEQSIEPPPIFGSLRQFITPTGNTNKTLFMVLEDEKVEAVCEIVRKCTGGLNAPNTGIMFTVPILTTEGII